MNNTREQHIIRSALWAAYGDVMGFPTELITREEFKRRNGIEEISRPFSWKKRIGGLHGPEISFPPGTYSDDTQLRLSTCRAIRGDGYFDVETFAKIELPIWANYALGAGRGSKAAAANLCLRESTWSQNFYDTGNLKYWNGGGNGAAMRIQPHVWQHHSSDSTKFMSDVVRNAICTHGHPRAIIGAAIHAIFLSYTLASKSAVPPSEWRELGELAAIQAYEALVEDAELSLVWIPNWEVRTAKALKDVWAQTVLEWHECIDLAEKRCAENLDPGETYRTLLSELGGFSPEERGSGLKTPLFATFLAWLFRDESPEAALHLAANTFKSDTDTIATMAGALIGVIADREPKDQIQDQSYIIGQAKRLYNIGLGKKQESFIYPDLLSWIPPKSQSDAWKLISGNPALHGLGNLSPVDEPIKSARGGDMLWQWCSLPFGQTVLIKHRTTDRVPSKNFQPEKSLPEPKTIESNKAPSLESPSPSNEIDIDDYTQLCIRSGFDKKTIGEALLIISERPNGIENAIGFSAIIAKAIRARMAK